MQFPKEILKCVIFIGYEEDGVSRITGTAFIITKPSAENPKLSHRYLVTAFHNILRAQERGLENIQLRVNLRGDRGAHYVPFPLDLFVFHPNHAEGLECVDVAVAPLNLSREYVDYLNIPIALLASEQIMESEQIGLGDEIAIVGLFTNHVGNTRNEPIVRVGNICAMPFDKVRTGIGNMKAYLIEARSIGGLSGSPVFAYMSHTRAKITRHNDSNVNLEWKSRVDGQPVIYCIGLIHGHYDTNVAMDDVVDDAAGGARNVNIGVAVVVPVHKILETLNQPKLLEREKQQELEYEKDLPHR